PGAGSGYVKLGQTQPVFPRDVPPPTSPRSRTSTSAPARRSSHAHASPITPAPTTATRTLVAPVLVPGARAGRLAEHGMQRKIGRVAACGHLTAERLGDRANVVRCAAAADAEVADAEVARAAGELRHLEACADERVERERE